MIEVIIKRGWTDSRATLGMLTVKGKKHDPFFTLENPFRETTKDSIIQAGVYNCRPYSGTKFKNVYIVDNVPGRSAILFHWGNTEKDTLGCILLGNSAGMSGGNPAVLKSVDAFNRFRQLIGQNNFKLTILD